MTEQYVPLTQTLRNHLVKTGAPEAVLLAAETVDLCRATLACSCIEQSHDEHVEAVRVTIATAASDRVLAELMIWMLLKVATRADELIASGVHAFQEAPAEVQDFIRQANGD